LVFFKRKEKPIKKAVKEAKKRCYRVVSMVSKGMFEEAYGESIEAYKSLTSFSQ